MEKLKNMFSPHKKNQNSKEKDEPRLDDYPMETSGVSGVTGLAGKDSTPTHHQEERSEGGGSFRSEGSSIDPRLLEQPAKEAIEQYYEETGKQPPMVTTNSTMTRTPTKDVTSTATVNPFTETYTTTTTFKKDQEDPDR
jgi:hypothetical protein